MFRPSYATLVASNKSTTVSKMATTLQAKLSQLQAATSFCVSFYM